MNNPQCCFVDTSFGDFSKRNNVMDIHDVKRSLPTDRRDCACTWHRFPEAYRDHWKRTGSVKAYRGTSYADFLPFDFDDDNGPEVSVVQVREFLKLLEISYEISGLAGVRFWFSGYKGFHVYLSPMLFGGWDPTPELHAKLKALAVSMARDFVIDSGIYDRNRLLRIENTVNTKSGLHKIPLTMQEILFLGVPDILKLAEALRVVEIAPWGGVSATASCADAWKNAQSVQKRTTDHGPRGRDLDDDIFNSALREGEGRDVRAFRIARYLRDGGMKPDRALKVLQFWNSKLDEPLTETDGDDVLEKKIKNAYGDVATEEDRIVPERLMSIEEMDVAYAAYIEATKSRKVTLGFRAVDLKLRGIAPGEICTVIAKSGVGKTAFLQNVLVHISNTQRDILAVFASMEQPVAQCFERWAQIVGGISGKDVEDGWNDQAYREELLKALRPTFGDRVWTFDVPNLKIEELSRLITVAETKVGRKVNVLALDYLGLMDGSDLDKTIYAQVSKLARGMKAFAKTHDLAIIMLCQVQRSTGDDGDTALTIHSARESGAIEESADFLLGLYRPEMKSEKDDKVTIQILKNRKGTTGAWTYDFNGETMRITEPLQVHSTIPHSSLSPMDLARSQRGV